jgi:hypothetical protein
MYVLCILLLYLLSQLPSYSRLIDNLKIRAAIILPLAVLIIGIVIFLVISLKKMSGSLKNIGTLEITKTNLIKQIADLTTYYSYNDILKIELENYFKNLSFSKPSSYTRSIKLIKTNSTEEVFIISNKSVDYKQKITIADSLKALKKLTNIDIQIKNN